MMNKRGFELSLNMIIIVILALVFLGVAITFIVKMMPKDLISIPSACDVYPPSSISPVCVNKEYEISRSSSIKMEVSFYNDEDADITASVQPVITCGKNADGAVLNFTSSSIGKNLPVGEASDYMIILKVPKDAVRGTYPCNLALSNTQKSFALVVK